MQRTLAWFHVYYVWFIYSTHKNVVRGVSALASNKGGGDDFHDVLGRRKLASACATTTSAAGWLVASSSSPAHATSVVSGGLAAKLAARDPSLLSNSVFNVPPSAQVYPDFMRGNWKVHITFGGYLFPSKKISKERLTQNPLIPGFQKCSIAALCDVGKEDAVSYQMIIDPSTGLEDRRSTLSNQINGFLGYSAVKEILYNPTSNPNRLSIDFIDYKTTNAERIELFCNARESASVPDTGVFVCSEYLRQVTFGTGSNVGIPRQVGGNYAHFWTWRPSSSSLSSSSSSTTDDEVTRNGDPPPKQLRGNLLTAAYLDPQDAMFFDEPTKPVAVYSHVLTATQILV